MFPELKKILFSPEHWVLPSPVSPGMHKQSKLPTLFTHCASLRHPGFAHSWHSFISKWRSQGSTSYREFGTGWNLIFKKGQH